VARMIGPAIAGALIATVGSGWVFLINATSFTAVISSLTFLRIGELHLRSKTPRSQGGLADGFRYIRQRPDIRCVLLMLFLIGTFGLNFPIFISTMSVSVFHAGAGQYGLLTSIMAMGSVAGALLAARRARPHIALLFASAAILGFGFALAAIMPNYGLFGLALIIIGVSAQTFTTSANSMVQLSTDPVMRGARDGHRSRHRFGRHTYRRADRRLGSRYIRPALGARRRCRRGFCRSGRRYPLPDQVPSHAGAHRGRMLALELR
jgi:hypothetical protein